MSNGTCSIGDCTKKVVARKMCNAHYIKWRTADPTVAGVCSVEGCESPARTRGWCNKHYQRWQKFGDAAHPVDERKATRVVDLDNGDRVCGQCKAQKPLDAFHRDARGRRGHRGNCAECELADQKSYYQANKERICARQAAYRTDDPERIRNLDNLRYQRDRDKRIELATAHSQNRRARILGRELDKGITVLRLRKLYGDSCPYCSCKLEFKAGKRSEYNRARASIEHIIPISKGGTHTWDNVVLACLGCNLSRGNRTAPAPVQQHLGYELFDS